MSNYKVGDTVFFKSDHEQCGTVVEVKSGGWLVLKSDSETGFGGDYIRGNEYTTVHISKCWTEE